MFTQINTTLFSLSGVPVRPDGTYNFGFPVISRDFVDTFAPVPTTGGTYATPVSDLRIIQPGFLPDGAQPRGVISSTSSVAATPTGAVGTLATSYIPTAPANQGGTFNSAGISSYTTMRIMADADTTLDVFASNSLIGSLAGAQSSSLSLNVTAVSNPFTAPTTTQFSTSVAGTGTSGFQHTLTLLRDVVYFLRFDAAMGVTDLSTQALFGGVFGVRGAAGDTVVPLGFVPIPASAGMMLLAFGGLLLVRRNARRRAA